MTSQVLSMLKTLGVVLYKRSTGITGEMNDPASLYARSFAIWHIVRGSLSRVWFTEFVRTVLFRIVYGEVALLQS
jgi:hypothetical protein